MVTISQLGTAVFIGAVALCPDCEFGAPATAGAVTVVAAASPGVTVDTAIVRLTISGMTCGSCATTARIALQRVPGVYQARVSYDSSSAVVSYDPAATSPARLIAQLAEMTGYQARVVETPEREDG